MCLSPIKIVNQWYCPFTVGDERRSKWEKLRPLYFLHDTVSFMREVPCGVCSECRMNQQQSFVQRTLMMSKYCYLLFGTLTYRDEALPRIEVNGFNLKFADIRDFRNFIKRVRKYKLLPDFRYLAVTEYGSDESKHHRPHFHFLIFIPYKYENGKPDLFKGYEYAQILLDFITQPNGWSRSLGDSFNPLYFPLSQFIRRYKSYTYDCHLVTQDGNDNVAYYVTKYVLKFSQYVEDLQSALRLNLDPEEYNIIWSIVRPKILTSNGVGISVKMPNYLPFSDLDCKIENDIQSFIQHSIQAGEERPYFYWKNQKYPLCQYYIDRCMTLEQRIQFHNIKYDNPFEDESKLELDIYDNNIDNYLFKLDNFEKWKIKKKRLNDNKY